MTKETNKTEKKEAKKDEEKKDGDIKEELVSVDVKWSEYLGEILVF